MCSNNKYQRNILHAPGCAVPYISINKVQEGLTKLCNMYAEFTKESDRVHAYLSVATLQQREEWTHHTCVAMATETEEIKSDDEESVMNLLI